MDRYIKSLLRRLFALFVSSAKFSIHFSILARLFVYTLAQIKTSKDSPNNRIPSKSPRTFTLLVLSISEFRSDIQCIANTGSFRLLYIRGHWQSRLFNAFYSTEQNKYGSNHNPDKSDFQYGNNRNQFRWFLLHFLRKFYHYTNIECVVSPHHRMVCDGDWGAVSRSIGIPFVLLPRDSQFNACKQHFKNIKEMFSEIPRFEGTHVIVQSRSDIPAYVQSGYIASERQITALGCPRMDDYIREHYTDPVAINNESRSTIVYLPIRITGGKPFEKSDVPTLSLFQSTIFQCLLKIAVKHPNLTVVVKPKPKVGFELDSNDFRSEEFRAEITNLAIEEKIDLAQLNNFIIRSDLDVLKLFPTAKVVCAITTSALLEASAIGVRVVIPFFTELECGNLKEKLFFSDYYHLFEVAKNSNELFDLLTTEDINIENQRNRLTQQRTIFEDFISSTSANATQKYAAKLTSIIKNKESY